MSAQNDENRAYAERRKSVRQALFENGGVIVPWMRHSITPSDLAIEWDKALRGEDVLWNIDS